MPDFRPIDAIRYFDVSSCDQVCRNLAKRSSVLFRQTEKGQPNAEQRPQVMTWIRRSAHAVIRYARTDSDYEELLLARAPARHARELRSQASVYESYEENPLVPLRRKRGRKGRRSFHRQALSAIFASNPELIPFSYIHRWACQLEYADRHLVPHHFVDGFLLDVSTARAVEKASSKFIEPKYQPWVYEQLVKIGLRGDPDDCEEGGVHCDEPRTLPEIEGNYPSSLIASVKDEIQRRRDGDELAYGFDTHDDGWD